MNKYFFLLLFIFSSATIVAQIKTDKASIDSIQLRLMRLCYSNQIQESENEFRALAPAFIAVNDTANLRKLGMAAHCQDSETQPLGEATKRLLNEVNLMNNPAPEITFLPKDKLKNTIIIFYNPDCGSCERELGKLISNYPDIEKEKYRVVSVDAGGNETRYKEIIETFPWKNNAFFDLEYTSINYVNYGIFSGLPVIFVTDKKGNVKIRTTNWQLDMLKEANK